MDGGKINSNELTDRELNVEIEELKKTVKTYPDFPKKGVLFFDFFSLFLDYNDYSKLVDLSERKIRMYMQQNNQTFTHILGLESRGFIIGCLLAERFKIGFVPARKRNKLPGELIRKEYTTEYSTDIIEVQKNVLSANSRVLIVDDLLATGGTMKAASDLMEEVGVEHISYYVVFELGFLNGRNILNYPENLISLIDLE